MLSKCTTTVQLDINVGCDDASKWSVILLNICQCKPKVKDSHQSHISNDLWNNNTLNGDYLEETAQCSEQ